MPIRPARPEDLDAIRDCAASAYGRYVARIGQEPAPMIADFKARIGRGVVHVSTGEKDGEEGPVRGFIIFYPRGDHIHLENVAVAAGFQRRGIGRELIDCCEDFARQNGFAAVELYTNEKMAENLDLYPRLGYRETGRGEQDGFNRVFFRKEIA